MSFSHAQATASNNVSGVSTTLTATLTNNPAPGDIVCVGFVWYDAAGGLPASITVADANSNAYTVSPNSPSSVHAIDGGALYLFYLLNAPANASKTVTATYTSPGAGGITVLLVDDFTVSGGVAVFDTDIAGNGPSGTTINTPTVTPTGVNELLYSVGTPQHAVTSVNSPWTQGGINTGSGSGYILGASTAQALNMTVNTTGTWDSMGMAFSLIPKTSPGCTAHVQGAGTLGTAGANTVSTTLPATPKEGNIVLVGIEFFAGLSVAAITSIQDENGTAYTVTPNSPSTINGAASGQCFQAYLLKAPANAGRTITVVFSINSTSSGPAIWVDEFSYIGKAVFAADYSGTGTGTALNTPAAIGDADNELLYGCTSFEHVVNAVNSPWTISDGGFLTGEAAGYVMNSSAAGIAFNMGGNSSGNWSNMAQAIRFEALLQSGFRPRIPGWDDEDEGRFNELDVRNWW